jgi:hypothetical protein
MVMDNPHYVTPEEAEKKFCPHDLAFCRGSQCMAWRWRPHGHQDFAQGLMLQLPLTPEEPMTHGYCGMVRT